MMAMPNGDMTPFRQGVGQISIEPWPKPFAHLVLIIYGFLGAFHLRGRNESHFLHELSRP